jgi:hypothetical protein
MPVIHDLGHLGRLSIELVYEILENLPLSDLMSFRNINQSANGIVHGMTRFRIIVDHAPQALRGILAVQRPVTTTLLELFTKLGQRYCDRCGQMRSLARYLCLATNTRRCFNCPIGRFSDSCAFLREEEVLKRFDLTKEDPAQISSRWFPASRWTDGQMILEMPCQTALYSRQSAQSLHQQLKSKKFERNFEKFGACLHNPTRSEETEFPSSLRFELTAVIAPWISFNSG